MRNACRNGSDDAITDAGSGLKRSLSLPLLVLYGLGTTIGAGIFALLGKVAGEAGMFAPLAFLISSLIAAFTGFSFAELASRYPRAAGEAVYVQEAWRAPSLSLLVGLLVALAGTVSAAAIAKALVGYVGEFVLAPRLLTVFVLVLALGLLAAWGITESVVVAAVFTLVETGVLILVIVSGADHLAGAGERLEELLPPADTVVWFGILGGAFLAFYAFLRIGELPEDIV